MKILMVVSLLLFIINPINFKEPSFPTIPEAPEYTHEEEERCCYWRGGYCGCTDWGQVLCCDGSVSPVCTCEPEEDEDLISQLKLSL